MSSSHPKLLFDENFGKPLISSLKQVIAVCREPVEIAHILDFYEQGQVDDDVWIRELPKDWVVITGDRAKRKGGPKLPQICVEVGVTHVLLSAKLHDMKQFEKLRAVLSVWPELIAVAEGTRGSRYSLRKGNVGNAVLVGVTPKSA